MNTQNLVVASTPTPTYQPAPWGLTALESTVWRMGFTDGREGRHGETIPKMLDRIRPHYTAGFTAGMEVRRLATPPDWRDTQPTTPTTALPTP